MIDRLGHRRRVQTLLSRNRVVAIVGARQVGKTTLARQVASGAKSKVTWFDLENPDDLSRLSEPMLALSDLRGLVVLDEIHRLPDVFGILRVLVDRPRPDVRFLVLGSASVHLLKQSSETLAGRIAFHDLDGFNLQEVGPRNADKLWIRGSFPRSYLARSDRASLDWRLDFVRTFLERDIPGLGISIASATLRRFWTMLAHSHGQIWNASAFARSFGVADKTVRGYLDLLASTYTARVLQPFHENLRKRQVKSPKVFLSDSGLLHVLLGLKSRADVESHPGLGASWEGFAISQVANRLGALPEECHFWATHAGAELDLLVVRGRQRLGFEMKRTSAPKITRSMQIAMEDLGLKTLYVIHAGKDSYPLGKKIRAVALKNLGSDLPPLG
jgi:predicted AAA+ superfamily ATPase